MKREIQVWIYLFIAFYLFIAGHVGPPLPCNKIKLVDIPDMEYYAKDGKGEVRKWHSSSKHSIAASLPGLQG